MIKLKDILTEGSIKIGKGKFANIYNMKEDMKEGKFDPKNPQIHIHGLGVYYLKTLEYHNTNSYKTHKFFY